jgi:putative transposase
MRHLSHKIRLYPSNRARTHFIRACGIARFAYNWGLEQCKKAYEERGETLSGYDLSKQLNAIKKAEFPWMQEVSKWVPQQAVYNLGNAFSRFFTKKARYPKFKKKGRCRDSFYINANQIQIEDRQIRLPKLGWVRMSEEVRFPGRPLSVVISREADRWYASVQIEVSDSWEYPHTCKSQASVGVDLGIHDLVVLSTGEKFAGPKALRIQLRKLRRAGRSLSRRKKGSRRRERAKQFLGRLHARIKHLRQDYTHKLTAGLVERFALIGVEDLDVKGMLKTRYLARHISDMGWYELRRQLEYKAELAGGRMVVVDREFPSSSMCSACGHQLGELALGVRQWRCPSCGAHHDRDINAARNINQEAARGHREAQNARRGDVGPACRQTPSKREGGGHGC